jgi:hypothetical protein
MVKKLTIEDRADQIIHNTKELVDMLFPGYCFFIPKTGKFDGFNKKAICKWDGSEPTYKEHSLYKEYSFDVVKELHNAIVPLLSGPFSEEARGILDKIQDGQSRCFKWRDTLSDICPYSSINSIDGERLFADNETMGSNPLTKVCEVIYPSVVGHIEETSVQGETASLEIEVAN